jgi:hypothetical protein
MYANGIFSKEVKQGTSHHYLHEKATVTLWSSMRKAGIASLPFTRSSRTHNTQHQHPFYLITITIINSMIDDAYNGQSELGHGKQN